MENFLTVNQLKRFAAIELGEEWSIAQTEGFFFLCLRFRVVRSSLTLVQAVIAKFGNGVMDELALQKYLISSDNSVWNPEKVGLKLAGLLVNDHGRSVTLTTWIESCRITLSIRRTTRIYQVKSERNVGGGEKTNFYVFRISIEFDIID